MTNPSEPATAIEELLERRRFNPALNPPPVKAVYSIGDIPVCTPGNLSNIVAAPKTGKTATLEGMIAAVIKDPATVCDTLGFSSQNPEGHAVLHFDTEQSVEDHWHVVRRAMERAGRTEPPPWFCSFCLTGLPAQTIWQVLQAATRLHAQQFGGIHSILIDGYADLVLDVNDPKECNQRVAELHSLAITHACPLIGVLHLNPGTEKGRGHLGSQLERKCETNLRLEKKGVYSEIWSDKQRRAPLMKGYGPRFRFDEERAMHVSVEAGHEVRQRDKVETARNEAEDVFADQTAMRYTELTAAIARVREVSKKTAEHKIGEWRKLEVVEKGNDRLWRLTPCE